MKNIKNVISIHLGLYKIKWRKQNKHNFTTVQHAFDRTKVKIGKGTYGSINVYNNSTDAKLIIGNYCSIGDNVTFLVGMEHDLNRLSTFPFDEFYLNDDEVTGLILDLFYTRS